MKIFRILLLVVLAVPRLCWAQNNSAAAVIERDVSVPMRDGTVLRADIHRPDKQGNFPVLVYRTPYGKEFALEDYSTFQHAVERGYVVVVQDVRGRYASAGEFRAQGPRGALARCQPSIWQNPRP